MRTKATRFAQTTALTACAAMACVEAGILTTVRRTVGLGVGMVNAWMGKHRVAPWIAAQCGAATACAIRRKTVRSARKIAVVARTGDASVATGYAQDQRRHKAAQSIVS